MSSDGDPGDGGVRALLAASAQKEDEPERSVVGGAMKRLRLRRHGIENVNAAFGGIAKVARGLATLWSVENDRND